MPGTALHPPPRAKSLPEDARQRLLLSGLRLFAQQGFSKTSTRELAEAARVNVAAISYYFGDKAGLYRAVFFEPLGTPEDDIARYNGTELSLKQALAGFYAGFMEPLKRGDEVRLCMKLHFREMLEPTGLWEAAVSHGIRPLHEALLVLLCRHLQLAAPDDDVKRLAICLAGLGVHMHTGRDITEQIAPGLLDGAPAINCMTERLVLYAQAMVQAEFKRRSKGGSKGSKP
jgi:TetR/AcrR family transcriptional regulator, regulator of cefoperazone and chloramphenicol sensitivity